MAVQGDVVVRSAGFGRGFMGIRECEGERLIL